MADPLVLVVLLGTTPAPASDVILTTTRRGLGVDAIVLAEVAAPRGDADALAIAGRVHARAVAQVTWNAETTLARIHVHVAPESSWADDELRFGVEDAPSERARTIGYTIATMVQRIEEQRPAPTAPPPALPQPRRPARMELRLGGGGAIGDAASGGGGQLGVRLWPSRIVGLEASALARFGRVVGSSTLVAAGAGPVARLTIGSWLQVALATDVLVMHQSLRRAELTRARWIGAVDVVGELEASLGPKLGAYVSGGAEIAFGSTAVQVGAAEVGSLPVLRAIVGLGGRYRF